MERLFAPLDIYCERLDASFWAEPANALTNLLMVAAGLWGLGQVRARQAGAWAAVLCWWVVAIGAGSFLFHTTAIELTKWADIVPIGTFTLAMTLFVLRRFAGLSWPRTIACCVGYFALAATGTALLPSWLHQVTNGTTIYLPALGAYVFGGVVALAHGSKGGWYALVCAVLLLIGFFFRAIDQDICVAFPVGSHFLWHSFVAVMLAVNLAAVARYGAPSARRGRKVGGEPAVAC